MTRGFQSDVPVKGRRLLCLRELSCLAGRRVHRSDGRHDRVDSPSRTAKPRRRVGRGHEPRNAIPRLARCSVFKDRSGRCGRDSPSRPRPASKGDHRVYRPMRAPLARAPGFHGRAGSVAAPSRRRSAHQRDHACEAPLAHLEHLAVQAPPPACRAALPSTASPSTFTPPWSIRRRASLG